MAKTLADRISRNFSRVKIKKVSVRVPKLKARTKAISEKDSKNEIPVSSIVNMLIKAAVEKAKRERKEKIAGSKSYSVIKDEKDKGGGYGTASKGYAHAPHASYVDYGKLFSYLGSFRAKQPYENMAEHVGALNSAAESGSFVLADKESMDKMGRFEKYMKPQVMDTPIMALSLVPIAGLSSGEWEEIKMLMKFDPVTYTLKTKTS